VDVFERDRQWLSDDFKSSFMLAVALHIFLIMIAFITARVLGVVGGAGNAPLEILSASVRVDVVGMPKFTIEELRQMELPTDAPQETPLQAEATKVEEAKDVVKPDDLVIPDNKPKKSLTSFLENYSSQKVKPAAKEKKGEKGGKVAGLDSLIIEGNRLSKGTALVGNNSDMADSVFVGYVQTLPEKVRQNWRLPGFLKEQNLKCRVHLWIGPRGELMKVQIRESSGNSEYDALAEGAVRASSPFPAPPVDAAPKLATRGIVLGFPL
jgi:colicin import membrane protein